ncbi:MAG TPA: hypothetical protein VKA10_05510, partial [Prolixibacteraceae bacterium]|nr:hypothetical protein [Prolixibacteraceae bacterium]
VFYESSKNEFPFYNYGVIPQRPDTLLNAGYWKSGVLQEFYYQRFSDRFHTLRFWYQESKRDLPQLMSYEGLGREEFQKEGQFRFQYEWKKYSDELNYNFFTGINSNRLNYFRATPEFNFVNEDSKSTETSFLNHFRVFRKFDEETYATLSIDANYHQVDIFDNTNSSGYNADRFESSLMMNLHLKPSDRFAAFILVRSENYGPHFVPLIPSAGLEWQFVANYPVIFQMNAARNYHKPTLNDLYWLPGGNPDLLAEDGFTGDVSLSAEYDKGRIQFKNEITAFASFIQNWIMWQPALNGAYYWEANNVKDVFSRGLEYHFSAGTSWRTIRFKSGGNYSFTKTTNENAANSVDGSRGKQLIYIPKHKGNFYVSAFWKNFTIKYDLLYTGKRYTKSNNQESDFERILNPYWLSNIELAKKVEVKNTEFKMKFEIENLTGQDYQSILWRPMPGRYYNFSIAMNFNK